LLAATVEKVVVKREGRASLQSVDAGETLAEVDCLFGDAIALMSVWGAR